MSNLKYEKYILEIFEGLYEEGMTESEKSMRRKLFLSKTDTSMEDLDNMIEVGVSNGFSPEVQVNACKNLL